MYLRRPHPEEYDELKHYLTDVEYAGIERSAPLVHDLAAGQGTLDEYMDQVLHHTGVSPDELSLRRIFSYVDTLGDLLKTDQNVYGWPREN